MVFSLIMLEDLFLLMHDTRVCEIFWFQWCQLKIFHGTCACVRIEYGFFLWSKTFAHDTCVRQILWFQWLQCKILCVVRVHTLESNMVFLYSSKGFCSCRPCEANLCLVVSMVSIYITLFGTKKKTIFCYPKP